MGANRYNHQSTRMCFAYMALSTIITAYMYLYLQIPLHHHHHHGFSRITHNHALGFIGLPSTMPMVFSAHPKPWPGFCWLDLNHAYRNPFPPHSHTWFLSYHKPTLQSGFCLTKNLQSQNGFNITTNFMGVHIPHQSYITHSNSWSY